MAEPAVYPLASRATAKELIRVLAYPEFALTTDDREALLSDYSQFCETVKVPNAPPRTPIRRHPVDVPFATLAIVSHADLFVTAAHDLPSLFGALSGLVVKATTSWRNLDLLDRPLR